MTRAQLHQWTNFNRPHKRSRLRRAWTWFNSSPGPLFSLTAFAVLFALMFAWAFQVFTWPLFP